MRDATGSPTVVIECPERIACDVCEIVCRSGVISLEGSSINIPRIVRQENCTACGLCVAHCPGHAVFLIDTARPDGNAKVTVAFELPNPPMPGARVQAVDANGARAGEATVVGVRVSRSYNGTRLLELSVSRDIAGSVRGMEYVP
jgi:NAD-dependent dihydropyrimidine dehydrogenase PreA subunit